MFETDGMPKITITDYVLALEECALEGKRVASFFEDDWQPQLHVSDVQPLITALEKLERLEEYRKPE